MFKIGEFSKITQVSVRMLRYYDEQKLLEPAMIDETNGYRFYLAKQIDQLNRIILLRNMGFGVKEIKALLETWSAENIKDNLLAQIKKDRGNDSVREAKAAANEGMALRLGQQTKRM
ncbi:MAG: hypothetical protein PWP24_115 [Clostridiales bacterium]|nr:hypothetical protein [Clostridiales bacterium]